MLKIDPQGDNYGPLLFVLGNLGKSDQLSRAVTS